MKHICKKNIIEDVEFTPLQNDKALEWFVPVSESCPRCQSMTAKIKTVDSGRKIKAICGKCGYGSGDAILEKDAISVLLNFWKLHLIQRK